MTDDNNIDLFEHMDDLPHDLIALIDHYSVEIEQGDPYAVCREFLEKAQALGFTFEYGLDGEPYGLQRMSAGTNEMGLTPRDIESMAGATFKKDDHWVYLWIRDIEQTLHEFLVREVSLNEEGDLTLQFYKDGNPNRPIWRTYQEDQLPEWNLEFVADGSDRLKELVDRKPIMGEYPAPRVPRLLDNTDSEAPQQRIQH